MTNQPLIAEAEISLRKWEKLLLLILPILWILMVNEMRIAKGEYFLFFNYDGSYPYLLASLNIAQFIKAGYTQQPGIVCHIFMSLVIIFTHLFQSSGQDVVSDVFARSELYLSNICFAFSLLNALGIFILGYVVTKKNGHLLSGLFFQLTPLVFFIIMLYSTNLIPESILPFLVMILIAGIISYVSEPELTSSKSTRYCMLFGVTCGLIIATKISFLPLMIIPFLVIKNFSKKLLFVILSLVVFVVLFLIFSPDYKTLWTFVFKNILYSEKYGAGSPTVINTSKIVPAFGKIWDNFPFFMVTYAMIFLFLLIHSFLGQSKVIRASKHFTILIGVLAVMSIYILLVVKQTEGYYLIPGLLFTMLGLFSLFSIIRELVEIKAARFRLVFAFLFSLALLVPVLNKYNNGIDWFRNRSRESYKIADYVSKNSSSFLTTSTDYTSSLPAALCNGLMFAGSQINRYHSIIADKYPNFVYFHKWHKKFEFLDNEPELKQRLSHADTLIFQDYGNLILDSYKDELKKVTGDSAVNTIELFSNNNGEKVYKVISK
jgi:hypothetical protein